MAVNRFSLEQALTVCWSTKEDLELLYERATEAGPSCEDLANALLGVMTLHDMRCERAFRIFEEMIATGGFRD
jgi:hypothetical protein